MGLADEVHLSKGCYTGQEVLLRLITYASVRRGLARLDGDGPAPEPGAELRTTGERAGVVTSVAPAGSGWTALAVVRRDALEARVALELEGGRVTAPPVPFPDRKPLGLP